MVNDQVLDAPCWYVLYTHPKQETRAENNLRAWNVETFNPKLKERRFNRFSSTPSYITKQLFVRYIFAHFNARYLLHKICFTRGVHSIVGFGGAPTPVEDEIISTIKSQLGEDGFVRLVEPLKSGDKVMINDGPMAKFTGVFERGIKNTDRVSILLTTVNYHCRVVVERELVKKIA